eukprot:GDKK01069822.1.p1 GENE.GDKK01069822.1~~GDKK01069822.1.p1  ORF type:complete len:435 (+),score=20.28 GDKK01069822.1:1-1305(+)
MQFLYFIDIQMSKAALGEKKNRVWADDDDEWEATAPAHKLESVATPTWAAPISVKQEESNDLTQRDKKRVRHEELDSVLASTAPLLTSTHQRKNAIEPKAISTFTIHKEVATDIAWHKNGHLAVVGCGGGLQVFHSSGKHVEHVAKFATVAKGEKQRPVQQLVMASYGEDVSVRSQYTYFPSLVHLITGKVIPLKFLDVRESTSSRHSGTTMTAKGRKFDDYYTTMARPGSSTTNWSENLLAVVADRSVFLGNINSGSVVAKLHLPDPIVSCCFSSVASAPFEFYASTATKVSVFDVRKSNEVINEFRDQGTTDATVISQSSNRRFAIGSASGIVSYFNDASSCSAGNPSRTLRNLNTAISGIKFSGDGNAMAIWASDQKNGLRLCMADGTSTSVIPSFPNATARHDFIHCAAFCDAQNILSVGEAGQVTNYRL